MYRLAVTALYAPTSSQSEHFKFCNKLSIIASSNHILILFHDFVEIASYHLSLSETATKVVNSALIMFRSAPVIPGSTVWVENLRAIAT